MASACRSGRSSYSSIPSQPKQIILTYFSATGHTTLNGAHKILLKHLRFKSFRYQLLQHVTERVSDIIPHFAVTFKNWQTFSGNVDQHNLRMCGSENSYAVTEYTRGSPKVNMFCTVSLPNQLSSAVYLDILV